MKIQKGWTNDSEVWKALPNKIKEGKWTTVRAASFTRSRVPNKSGVYIFSSIPPRHIKSMKLRGFKTPLYIGKSINLKKRFTAHLKNPIVKGLRKTFGLSLEFNYLILDPIKEIELKQYEQCLINCFGPQFNEINSVKTGKAVNATISTKFVDLL